ALTILQTWASKGILLLQGFGMTETSPACIFLNPADSLRKLGSTGKALMHTEMRIVNDAGGDCAANEVGELWVAGPNITPGYWNRPDATAASFEGRWLKTGDAARVDDEGFVYIVDRWKDMYISGGSNVYPRECEDLLLEHPGVAEVAVLGMPDRHWGEVGVAVLVRRPGLPPVDEAALLAFLDGRLAKYRWPRQFVFWDSLPKSGYGKITKKDIRQQLLARGDVAVVNPD
ncbi:MAG: acid--CoA ligase, partial [Burkholderiales bacterium PBB5]